MRNALFAFAIGFAAAGTNAQAQPASALTPFHLKPGEMIVYSHRMNPRGVGYDIGMTCTVPPFTLGVITIAKIAGGTSRHDFEVATQVSTDGRSRLIPSGVLATGSSADGLPSVLFTPLASEPQDRIVLAHARDETPAQYRVWCDNVNIFEQAGWAALRTAFIAFLTGSELEQSDNVNRAINFAVSLFVRDNILAIGLDGFREETMIALNKQFPRNPVLVNFLGAFIDNMAQESLKHAFYELSPSALRR